MKNLYLATFFSLCFGLDAFSQAANPDVEIDSCPYDIIFIVDESGSMGGSRAADLRAGSINMVNAMKNTGTRLAVVEFESGANRALIGGSSAYQEVNDAYVTNFTNYINCSVGGGSSGYCPGGGTNWAGAMNVAHGINTGSPPNDGLADLVIIFTDGDPTVGGNGIAQANVLKADGSHIFVIAFAPGGAGESNVQDISGLDEYNPPVTSGSFLGYDYVMSNTFTTLKCR